MTNNDLRMIFDACRHPLLVGPLAHAIPSSRHDLVVFVDGGVKLRSNWVRHSYVGDYKLSTMRTKPCLCVFSLRFIVLFCVCHRCSSCRSNWLFNLFNY